MTTIDKYLKDIKQRVDGATEGLVAEEHNCQWDITNGEYLPKQRLFYAEGMSKEDALFFVGARTDVPVLLEMVDNLMTLIELACHITNDKEGMPNTVKILERLIHKDGGE